MSEEIKTSNALREFLEIFRGKIDKNGDVLTGRQFGKDLRRGCFSMHGSDMREKCAGLFKMLDESLDLKSEETQQYLKELDIHCGADELENWKLVLNYIVKQMCDKELPSDSPVLEELVHILHQGGVGAGMMNLGGMVTCSAHAKGSEDVRALYKWAIEDGFSGEAPQGAPSQGILQDDLFIMLKLCSPTVDLKIDDQGAVKIMISVTTAVRKSSVVPVYSEICDEVSGVSNGGKKLSDCPLFMKYYYPVEVCIGIGIGLSKKEGCVTYSNLELSLSGLEVSSPEQKTLMQKIIEIIREFFGISVQEKSEATALEKVTGITTKDFGRDVDAAVSPTGGGHASGASELDTNTVRFPGSVDFALLNNPKKVQAVSTTVQEPNSHQVVQRQLVDAY